VFKSKQMPISKFNNLPFYGKKTKYYYDMINFSSFASACRRQLREEEKERLKMREYWFGVKNRTQNIRTRPICIDCVKIVSMKKECPYVL
jgi:hypothetical protein